MTFRQSGILVALGGLLIVASPVLAAATDRATQSFDLGNALLAQGKFPDALKAYAAAAKADSDNQTYRQEYALLRRIIKMRERMDRERNPKKWQTSAEALRSFYYEKGIYAEALALDKKVHTRLDNAESAAQLAESQLALDMNAEAAALLAAMPAEQVSPHGRLLLGIALARSGRIEEARAIAAETELPEIVTPGMLYDWARLRSLVGDRAGALASLTQCMEATPPSQLDAVKADAKRSRDFGVMLASTDFAKVLETESKVKESGCSSGSSCGKCPSRGGCSSSKAKGSSKQTARKD